MARVESAGFTSCAQRTRQREGTEVRDVSPITIGTRVARAWSDLLVRAISRQRVEDTVNHCARRREPQGVVRTSGGAALPRTFGSHNRLLRELVPAELLQE